MDESTDRKEGAGVHLDNDRSQRHDAKNTQRRKQSLSDTEDTHFGAEAFMARSGDCF